MVLSSTFAAGRSTAKEDLKEIVGGKDEAHDEEEQENEIRLWLDLAAGRHRM